MKTYDIIFEWLVMSSWEVSAKNEQSSGARERNKKKKRVIYRKSERRRVQYTVYSANITENCDLKSS